MQLGLVARKRAIEREGRDPAHVVDGDRSCTRSTPSCRSRSRGVRRARSPRSTRDLAGPAPMHRLLQGEVGSGKTVVALTALLVAVQGGHQGAFMAPTEVLAEQHTLACARAPRRAGHPRAEALLGERPVRVELLTNRTPAAERRRITAGLRDGAVDLVVGTHALIYEGVQFADLGVAVIDEQHRFGVEQRDLLRGKGLDDTQAGRARDDGDADPAHRRDAHLRRPRPVRAARAAGGARADHHRGDRPEPARAHGGVRRRLRAEVAAGRQAYIVCPLVEGSAKLEAKAATEEFERLQAEDLAGLRLGLLHGQMAAPDKEARDGRASAPASSTCSSRRR